MNGATASGPVVVFDTDDYYMGSVVAERLRAEGCDVVLVTPEGRASPWTQFTLELNHVNRQLAQLGVRVVTNRNLTAIERDAVRTSCVFSDVEETIACGTVVLVTMRIPRDALYHDLLADSAALQEAGVKSVARIGDCLAPGIIAHAVHAGHLHARELDAPKSDAVPFKNESVLIER